MGLSQFDEYMPFNQITKIVTASALAFTAITANSLPPLRIDNILASNDDTIAHVVELSLFTAGTDQVLGSVSIAAGQGFAGTPAVDLLALILPATQTGIVLDTGNLLRAAVDVAMQAGKTLHLTCLGGRV